MMRNVLIIDDDLLFRRTLKYGLQDETTTVYYVESVMEAMQCLLQNDYALIIMDTQLTGTDGVRLLGMIHQARLHIPIMILTTSDNLDEQLMALEIGADLVLEKKSGPIEYLIGHARALMLRNEERKNGRLSQNTELQINLPSYTIQVNHTPIKLSRKEFEVFAYMAGNPGIVLTRDMIYNRIWGWETLYDVDDAVRYYIKVLRKKLSIAGNNYIETVYGVGYRFIPTGVKIEK